MTLAVHIDGVPHSKALLVVRRRRFRRDPYTGACKQVAPIWQRVFNLQNTWCTAVQRTMELRSRENAHQSNHPPEVASRENTDGWCCLRLSRPPQRRTTDDALVHQCLLEATGGCSIRSASSLDRLESLLIYADVRPPRMTPPHDRKGPAAEASIVKSIQLRVQLKPYIMALAANATKYGTPLMRPLWFDFPTEMLAMAEVEDAFMFGPKYGECKLHTSPPTCIMG